MMIECQTCKTKEGKPRSTYEEEWEAQESADYANDEYGNNLVPYKCEKCDRYCLTPKDRQTPSVDCVVCGKKLYETEEAAKTRAGILYKEKRKSLRVYKCPSGSGYHLTRKGA